MLLDIQNQYEILQGKFERNNQQINTIRSFLYNDVKTFEDFLQGRYDLNQVFYDYETNSASILISIKGLIEKTPEIINHNQSLMIELQEVREELFTAYEKINDYNYQNDISDSQINYYKKQMIEKDNYIYHLKKKISEIQVEKNPMNLAYTTYNEITLPQRIKRKATEDRLSNIRTNSLNGSQLTDLNLNNSINTNNIKQKYESHSGFGYDYKEQDIDNTMKHFESCGNIVGSNGSDLHKDKNNELKVPLKGTIAKRVHQIIMNLWKNDDNVDYLQKAFGNEIIQKISSGKIDVETLDKVEKGLLKHHKDIIKKEEAIRKETSKCLDSKKQKTTGWDRLKGYTNLKGKYLK